MRSRSIVELEHAVPMAAIAPACRSIIAGAAPEIGLLFTNRQQEIRIDVVADGSIRDRLNDSGIDFFGTGDRGNFFGIESLRQTETP